MKSHEFDRRLERLVALAEHPSTADAFSQELAALKLAVGQVEVYEKRTSMLARLTPVETKQIRFESGLGQNGACESIIYDRAR